MKFVGNNRRTWLLAVILALILAFIFVVSAPASNRIMSGSTWGSAPDGYGGWYDYMEEQGVPIERWQRPLEDLIEKTADLDQPATLIQIRPAIRLAQQGQSCNSALSPRVSRDGSCLYESTFERARPSHDRHPAAGE